MTVPLAHTMFPIPSYPCPDLLTSSSVATVVGITQASVLLICVRTVDTAIFPCVQEPLASFCVCGGGRGRGTENFYSDTLHILSGFCLLINDAMGMCSGHRFFVNFGNVSPVSLSPRFLPSVC